MNYLYLQRGLFITVASLSIVSHLLGMATSDYTMIVILAISVFLLGIPHGAADPVVAKSIGLWKSKADLAIFSMTYVLISAIALLFWLFLPRTALVLFLAISVWHFAGDWYDDVGGLLSNAISASLISLPALFHPNEVETLFRTLTGLETQGITFMIASLAPIVTLIAFCSVFKLSLTNITLSIEVFVLLVAAALLPPLWFFLLYFCFLHSPKHIIALIKEFEGKQLFKTILIYTAITGFFIWGFWDVVDSIAISDALVKLVFLCLFALTVPHMILVELFRKEISFETKD